MGGLALPGWALPEGERKPGGVRQWDWAFSEAVQSSEERERSQRTRPLESSGGSRCCHEFNRLEFEGSQPN